MSQPKKETPPLKIASVQITGYRGFPVPITLSLAPHDSQGRLTQPHKAGNLLLYGENGSGKSSFGKALRDFLNYKKDAPAFDDYQYRYEAPRIDRSIKITFDDGKTDSGEEKTRRLEWNPTDRDKSHPLFMDMARSIGWLDYREIWRATDVRWGDHVDVFEQLVETIIAGCPLKTSSKTFGDIWKNINETAENKPTKAASTINDLNQLKLDINSFNNNLQVFLPKLERKANELLASFTSWTKLKLEWLRNTEYDLHKNRQRLYKGAIKLKMLERDDLVISKPPEFLNEARLTAAGLCLYLAGLILSAPQKRSDGIIYPRLLILDDILLSLDMSNRQPLLELLKSDDFKNWQVLLLTHDRVWYEIAKRHLGAPKWCHYEFYTVRVGDYEHPITNKDEDHLDKAIEFLIQGHLKPAAVHVRTKLEEVLKKACQDYKIKIAYYINPREVSLSMLWDALLSHPVGKLPPQKTFTKDGVIYEFRNHTIPDRLITNEFQAKIECNLSWILNPLSHSESINTYRAEVENAIFDVAELEYRLQQSLIHQEFLLTYERTQIMSLIKTHDPDADKPAGA